MKHNSHVRKAALNTVNANSLPSGKTLTELSQLPFPLFTTNIATIIYQKIRP